MSGADGDDSHIIASVRRILGEDAARTRPEPFHDGGAPPSDDVYELSPDMLIEPIAPLPQPQPQPVPLAANWATSRTVDTPPATRQILAGARETESAVPDEVAGGEATGPRAALVSAPLEVSAEPDRGRAVSRPASEPAVRGTPAAGGHPEHTTIGNVENAAVLGAAGQPVFDEAVVEPRTANAAGEAFDSLRHTLRTQRDAAAAASTSSIPALATSSHAGGPTIEQMIREELRPLLKGWLDAHLPGLVDRAVRAEIARIVGKSED